MRQWHSIPHNMVFPVPYICRQKQDSSRLTAHHQMPTEASVAGEDEVERESLSANSSQNLIMVSLVLFQLTGVSADLVPD